MMLHFLTLILSGIIAVHPASKPEGRILSMYDANLNGRLYPYTGAFLWEKEKSPEPEFKMPLPEGPAISYGTAVSRNEFGISGGVFPSNSGKLAAVYRLDESRVSEFPLLDINTRTGSLKSIRYPMNGMDSEHVGLCVIDAEGQILSTMQVNDFDDERYLTNITWSPDDKYIFIHVLDRQQHHMKLNMYRADNGAFVRTILEEQNDAWVEPQDPVRFVKGSYSFIYRTNNRDGYMNLYLCDTLGTVRRLTSVDADVEYVANDGQWLYYTTAEFSPVENHLMRMSLRNLRRPGKPQRLTTVQGWHRISMKADCSEFIDRWSSFNDAGGAVLRKADGSLVEELAILSDPLADYAQCEMELGTVKSADGAFDNYYRLYKPLNFDPSKKYPLIVYVYGGPHSQLVRNSWLGGIRMWEMLMAQKGYVVYVQDNRGTPNRGQAFEQAINRQCGQAEMADQIAGLKSLLERSPWIDRDRIGVHGWSYGGFMTITLAANHPEYFKVAVAGGPVIDWKWYEVMYGERYMDTPQTNPEGFEKTSLINKAADLKSRLLICQGAIDATVVWQHSLSFVQQCIMNGVQLDYFPYPCDEHNMRGKARVHLYQKITDYFDENL